MIKKVFPVLALSMFSSTLGMGIVSPLLPLYARDMGATGTWLGIIVASYSISNSIVVPITGRLSDQKGKKLLLVIGLLAYAIISLGYVWAANPVQLSLVRFIQGIAGAMTFPIATAYVGDLSPEGEEGKWMGYASAAFFSGFGFGPFIGGIATEHFGITATFYVMGALNLLAGLATLFFLPEASRKKSSEDPPHLSFKEMSASKMMKGLFSLRLAQALGRGTTFTFLPVFAAILGMSISLIGTLLTINILAITLLTPIGGVLADRFSRVLLSFLGVIIATVFLALVPFTFNFWQLLIVMLIQGVGMAISMPASSALGVEEGRKYGMGSTMSVLFLAFSIGMAIGPILSGVIVELLDINSMFYIIASIGTVASFHFLWVIRTTGTVVQTHSAQ
ncbi:MAG: MFS transporter [Dehalococcoidales bacterium]|nr:MFS transporter [Dehalococcoidales bacterium]